MRDNSPPQHFVICLRNEGCEDLQARKLYPVLSDPVAERDGFLRVVDESGEDYLYPTSFFAGVELPEELEETLAAIAR